MTRNDEVSMGGWHTRLWRRVRIAPGVTINLSKAGASVSVGPRGAKVTVGRRGVRQTVGIPGTGFYATRQLSGPRSSRPTSPTFDGSAPTPDPADTTAADLSADDASAAAVLPGAAVLSAAAAAPDSADDSSDEIVLYFGLATGVGVLFGFALYAVGLPSDQATTGGVIAVVVGVAYEGLAHHHPGPAKAAAAVVVGLIAIATAAIIAIGVATVGALLLVVTTGGTKRRSRRR